jgi:hypothetical protein
MAMTHRRRLLLILSLLALAAVGISVVLCLTQPKHRINRDTLARIQPGMTVQEVEDLLGVPPGNNSGGKNEVLFGIVSTYTAVEQLPALNQEQQVLTFEDLANLEQKKWIGEEYAILVLFDKQGRVLVAMEGFVPSSDSVLARMRRWLHW